MASYALLRKSCSLSKVCTWYVNYMDPMSLRTKWVSRATLSCFWPRGVWVPKRKALKRIFWPSFIWLHLLSCTYGVIRIRPWLQGWLYCYGREGQGTTAAWLEEAYQNVYHWNTEASYQLHTGQWSSWTFWSEVVCHLLLCGWAFPQGPDIFLVYRWNKACLLRFCSELVMHSLAGLDWLDTSMNVSYDTQTELKSNQWLLLE